MAAFPLAIGTVLFANGNSIVLTHRTLVVTRAGMRLPVFHASLVLQYDLLGGTS